MGFYSYWGMMECLNSNLNCCGKWRFVHIHWYMIMLRSWCHVFFKTHVIDVKFSLFMLFWCWRGAVQNGSSGEVPSEIGGREIAQNCFNLKFQNRLDRSELCFGWTEAVLMLQSGTWQRRRSFWFETEAGLVGPRMDPRILMEKC